jgi:hypothetical protein
VAQETFLNYRSFRWLWITTAALVVCTVAYVVNDPIGGANGGTVLGYSYGVLATIGIIWLMCFGLRKRAYRSSLGTLQGWLAAHIWIGLGLLILVPLHSGFSFGLNVHTLAYVLMVLTIVTGIWGAANYSTLSARITSNRGGGKERASVEQIATLSTDIDLVSSAKSDQFLAMVRSFDFTFTPCWWSLIKQAKICGVDKKAASQLMANLPEVERDEAVKVLGFIDQKVDLARSVLEESRIKAALKIWLYLHVPVSVGLCVALAIHIFSVFYYW